MYRRIRDLREDSDLLQRDLAAYGGGQRPRLRSSAAAVRPNGHPNIDS